MSPKTCSDFPGSHSYSVSCLGPQAVLEEGETCRLWKRICIPVPLPSRMTLGKLFNHSMPQLPPL